VRRAGVEPAQRCGRVTAAWARRCPADAFADSSADTPTCFPGRYSFGRSPRSQWPGKHATPSDANSSAGGRLACHAFQARGSARQSRVIRGLESMPALTMRTVARAGVEPAIDHQGLSPAALPVCVPRHYQRLVWGSHPSTPARQTGRDASRATRRTNRTDPGVGIEPTPPGSEPGVTTSSDDPGVRLRRVLGADPRRHQSGWPDLNRRSPASHAGGFVQPFLHPDEGVRIRFLQKKRPPEHPAGVEPAQLPWQGNRLPLHHRCLFVLRCTSLWPLVVARSPDTRCGPVS
jgi:hypothetical protein